MKTYILLIAFLGSLLMACEQTQTDTADNKAETTDAVSAPIAATTDDLPESAPAIGTSISNLVKPSDPELKKRAQETAEYKELDWEDLELPGQGLADIITQYQPKIDAIPEGDPAEDALLEELQSALNSAPVNTQLDGQKIKIPGFISPLEVDETKGMVKEFLLVPYFGACIHVPPPPLNQTLLVRPQAGKSIGMERMYEPVWVYGTINADRVQTDLADAGYQINDAMVEIYAEEDSESAQN